MMNNLKSIKTTKDIVVPFDTSIKNAMGVMYQNKNGCVVLLKENKPIGIITESDIVNGFNDDINFTQPAITIAKKNLITTDENRPIEFAFDVLGQNNIRRIILVNKNKEYAGVVLQEDLFDYLEEDVYKEDLKISNIIDTTYELITVDINETIYSVLNKMKKHQIGSLIVMHDKHYVGIITEKDILKLTYNEVDKRNKVSLHMTSPVVTITDDIFVTNAIDIMKIKNIRRVVVVNKNNKLLALLTNRDILKHIKGNYARVLQNKIKNAQEIMNFLPEPIVEIYDGSEDNLIYWMNKQAQNIFGTNLMDKSILKIINKSDWLYIQNILIDTKTIKDIAIKINDRIYEVSGILSKNAETKYMKLIFKDVTSYETEKEKLQNIIDIEIKKRLDSEYLMMQQSKLATMGEMIGHIAHQWRQPLAQLGGIFMNIGSASNFEELDEQYLNKKLNDGNKLIKYMSQTIEDFRNFFEPNKEKERFDISEYINNAVDLIKASLTFNHIKLTFTQKDKKITSIGYPSEFAQVILNILANSEDALVSRGVKEAKIDISISDDNQNILIKIKDNAGGIELKNINKIFDIYFTTKTRKEGSGLGLYMSKLIIETKLGGTISAENDNKGAVFTVKLPVTRE
ncbi:MAG: CBS domain-containing protein [Campylobacterota bacterium]|nr:CBS domain-containing protein [Campylobacterota bacterium]